MAETTWQTKEYMEAFGIPAQELLYDGQIIKYMIRGKMAHLQTTLMDSCVLTVDLLDYIFDELNVNAARAEFCMVRKPLSAVMVMRKERTSDFLLDLRAFSSFDQYLAGLGKKTRNNLRYYQKRFDKYLAEGGFKFRKDRLTAAEDAGRFHEICEEIYRLNEARCLSKGFQSGADRRWIQVFETYGTVTYYEINSRVIAGTVVTDSGHAQYLHMIAHDNEYSNFDVGNLVLKDTIESAFDKAVYEFHFLWGGEGKKETNYKVRFGASQQQLWTLTAYKSQIRYRIEKNINRVRMLAEDWKDILKKILKKYVRGYEGFNH